MSFKKFLGLETGDKVPDEKTVWLFRERLTQAGSVEDLFELFISHLEQKGLIFNEGQIIDASFTEIPLPLPEKTGQAVCNEGLMVNRLKRLMINTPPPPHKTGQEIKNYIVSHCGNPYDPLLMNSR
jgi:IS5 family transposase